MRCCTECRNGLLFVSMHERISCFILISPKQCIGFACRGLHARVQPLRLKSPHQQGVTKRSISGPILASAMLQGDSRHSWKPSTMMRPYLYDQQHGVYKDLRASAVVW